MSRIIDRILNFLEHIGCFGKMLYQTIIAFADFRTYRSNIMDQMTNIGVRSLPIIAYISLFMGMVIGLQAVNQFTQTVPLYIAGTVVEKTILQELSSVIVGLVLAGRVGAAIAAEIGTMKVTEQIDALEAMAFNPIAYLVVPRLIAGVIMIPVVTVFSTVIAFIAAWLTAINLADLTTYEFFKGAKLFANWRDFALPISKSIIFGATIILISCYQGFRTEQGAEGVGRSATNAVVVICLMILTFDFVMAKFILG